MMRRREFIAGPGTAVVSPVVARGQESDRMRRVGVPMGGAESRVCALTAMLALIGALPALALDWQVKTKPGKEVVAHRYTTGISKTCRILGLPKITITVKPLNGSVDIRKASAIALTARRRTTACWFLREPHGLCQGCQHSILAEVCGPVPPLPPRPATRCSCRRTAET
jgi:hypothetical protein